MAKSKIQREIDNIQREIDDAEYAINNTPEICIASYRDSEGIVKWAIKSYGTMKYNFESAEKAFEARFD